MTPARSKAAKGKATLEQLMAALEQGQAPVVAAVLRDNPSLTQQKDLRGRFPLFVAAAAGRRDLCDLLLQHGAKVKAKTVRESAVHFAASSGDADLARYLLERGAPLNFKCRNDWTQLHDELYIGTPATAMLLIELGMNVALVGKLYGMAQTPLHLAVKLSHSDLSRAPGLQRGMVQAMLDRGADPHVFNGEGESALHVACDAGRAEIVALLLDRGAKIEHRDASGGTPLFFAIGSGNLATVRLLLDRGAKFTIKLPASAGELAGATPLQIAQRMGHRFIERLLCQRGAGQVYAGTNANVTYSRAEIHSAAARGELEDVRWILRHDPAEVHALRPRGFISVQPLVQAATFGHAAVAQFLIEHGAIVNDPAAGQYTALHSAAQQDHVEVVKLLLAAGADVNAGAGAQTALHAAARQGYLQVVQVLLDAGADPGLRDSLKRTPLADARSTLKSGFERAPARARIQACIDLLRSRSPKD